MNDVRPVLDDDALLDDLARGARPDGAGPAEDLLLALRADALLAVPPPTAALSAAPDPALDPARDPALDPALDHDLDPEPALDPVPAAGRPPRVVRVRGALAGSMVAAAVLAGTSGVAAAVTGDPLAGLTGVRDAVQVAAEPDDRTPLLRSREGARLHQEVERVADLLAAGRVEDARTALAAMPSLLSALAESEQRLLRDELASAAPDLVEAAGLVEHPVRPGHDPGQPTGPATQAPGVDGDDGATSSPDPTPPTDGDDPPKTSKPPKTTPPGTTPPTSPTTPPVTTPPEPDPTPPTTSAAAPPPGPPSASAAAPAPPPTSAVGGPGQGGPGQGGPGQGEPGHGVGKPPKPPKPPRTPGPGDAVATPG